MYTNSLKLKQDVGRSRDGSQSVTLKSNCLANIGHKFNDGGRYLSTWKSGFWLKVVRTDTKYRNLQGEWESWHNPLRNVSPSKCHRAKRATWLEWLSTGTLRSFVRQFHQRNSRGDEVEETHTLKTHHAPCCKVSMVTAKTDGEQDVADPKEQSPDGNHLSQCSCWRKQYRCVA
jgi:hypothetical protein